jgi:ABC-type lipoprotein export system ATPase subunit
MRSPSAVLVAFEGVEIAYEGTPVLKDVELEVRPGTPTVLVGRSGCGKTSLLLVAAGLIAPSAGHVTWPGLEQDATERLREIALVFQAPALMAELTALENVCLPLRLAGRTAAAAGDAAARALESVDLDRRHWTVLPAQLSGGEQQRVEVARAIAGEPKLVIADEPTGALDRAHADAIIASLQGVVRRTGAGLLVATHDEQIAERFERRILLEGGTAHGGTW